MADQLKLCFTFLLVLHVSLVSCRHDYYQYYSQYVKGESSTESNSSSTTGISTNTSADISVPKVLDSENVISPKDNSYSSSNNDAYERYPSKPVQSAYTSDNEKELHSILMIRLGLIFGCIIAVGLILCCIAVCCPRRFKGKERRGYVISTNTPAQQTVNMMQPQIPQAVPVEYSSPETQHPPPYNTQPIQQQFQYPTTFTASEQLLHQNPMQPVGQQQPLLPYGYNPETVSPPYPTKN